jgi:hypothetical protein
MKLIEDIMPTISIFYGIVIRMFFRDVEKHSLPHLHADYQRQITVYSITDKRILAGTLPANKNKLVINWIEIHKEDLLSNWQCAVHGKHTFSIKGLDQ